MGGVYICESYIECYYNSQWFIYILAFCKSSLELQAFIGSHMQVHSLARTIKSSCCCFWWFELRKCLRVCIDIYGS